MAGNGMLTANARQIELERERGSRTHTYMSRDSLAITEEFSLCQENIRTTLNRLKMIQDACCTANEHKRLQRPPHFGPHGLQ